MKVHDVFHIDLLFKSRRDKNHHFEEPPLVVGKLGEEWYKVDSIVGSKHTKKDRWLYQVQWKDYGPEEDTWEPKGNLEENSADELQKYHNAQIKHPCDSAKEH